MKEIKITSNGIKQAIDDLVNENELLQDKIYKQNEETKRLNNIINKLEKILINNKLYGEDIYKKSKLTKEQFKKEYPYTLGSYQNSTNLLLRLQELKGDGSNENFK